MSHTHLHHWKWAMGGRTKIWKQCTRRPAADREYLQEKPLPWNLFPTLFLPQIPPLWSPLYFSIHPTCNCCTSLFAVLVFSVSLGNLYSCPSNGNILTPDVSKLPSHFLRGPAHYPGWKWNSPASAFPTLHSEETFSLWHWSPPNILYILHIFLVSVCLHPLNSNLTKRHVFAYFYSLLSLVFLESLVCEWCFVFVVGGGGGVVE